MISSPNSSHGQKHKNQLYPYLPNKKQQLRNQAIYNNFSSMQQIRKLIQVEKQRFNNDVNKTYEKIDKCTKNIQNGKKINRQMMDKISGSNKDRKYEENILDDELQMPKFWFSQINYKLNQNPKNQNLIKKQKVNILSLQIQKLEKQCAKLYLSQNDKFNEFQKDLFQEIDRIHAKCLENRQESEQNQFAIQITKYEQILKQRIKECQKNLGRNLDGKIIKTIEKIQAKM